MDPTQTWAIITALGGAVSVLAGTIYKMQSAQIADLKAENTTLRDEAREAVRAKDQEIAEWRRQAQARIDPEPRR